MLTTTDQFSNVAIKNFTLVVGRLHFVPAFYAAAKCDLHNRERTVCCRDLKGDDERHLVDPDIVRDIIMCVREPRQSFCEYAVVDVAALALLSISLGSAQWSR